MEAASGDIIAIIGFMGSGKSTIGALLADKLEMDFVDLDEVIAMSTGRSIREIFAAEGEEGFRDREREALKEQLTHGGKVIACGGGIVLRDDNVVLLRERCRVFLLRISQEKALERLMGDGGERPLLAGEDREKKIRELMRMREDRYIQTAHVVVDADRKEPEEIVEEIAARWNG